MGISWGLFRFSILEQFSKNKAGVICGKGKPDSSTLSHGKLLVYRESGQKSPASSIHPTAGYTKAGNHQVSP